MDERTQLELPHHISQLAEHLAWYSQDVAALVAHDPREARHSTSLRGVSTQLVELCRDFAVPKLSAESAAHVIPVLEKLRRMLVSNDLGALRVNRDRSERELLGQYERLLERPLPLAVATSLLRQHDELKRAAHARRSAAVRRITRYPASHRAHSHAAHGI